MRLKVKSYYLALLLKSIGGDNKKRLGLMSDNYFNCRGNDYKYG